MKNNKKIDQSKILFDLNFFSNSKKDLLTIIQQNLSTRGKTTYIFSPNPEQIVLADKNHDFKEALQRADYLIPDGIGLVLASRFLAFRQDTKLKERIAGVELSQDILELAREKCLNVLIVGGKGYDQASCGTYPFTKVEKSLLKEKPNGFQVYWLAAYKSIKRPQSKENDFIHEVITKIKPTIIFVAFGAPEQELWIDHNRALFEQNQVKLIMPVGGSFDLIFHKLKRAPQVMRFLGLEWLFRLIQEPWRIKRQSRLLIFLFLTIREFFK